MAANARASSGRLASLSRGVASLVHRHVLALLLLGFSSGLPLTLSGSTLRWWMSEAGVDIQAIGLYALVGTPYTLKVLWAPVIDACQVPVLGKRLGHLRGWLVLTQLALMCAIAALGCVDPGRSPASVAVAAVALATVSATQDLAVDAFRVRYLATEHQAAGAAHFVTAYRIGMWVASTATPALVQWLQHRGTARPWMWGYSAMAGLVLIGLLASLLATEPPHPAATAHATAGAKSLGVKAAMSAVARPLSDFVSKRNAVLALVFVVAFKLCDTVAGTMTSPFVQSLGFDKVTFAAARSVGQVATIVGGLAGGVLAGAVRLPTALWVAGALQMVSNLMFTWLAWVGPSAPALALTLTVENFTGAMGNCIFVAYLSSLCTSPLHTATQYALLSALASTGRTTLSSLSGFLAAALGWPAFFVASAAAAAPSFMLLAWLQRRGHFALSSSQKRQ